MGKISCETHGKSDIVFISKNLKNIYLKNENTSLVKMTYKNKNLGVFIHYFSEEENIEIFLDANSLEKFEVIFETISNYPVICNQCFSLYLKKNQIHMIEREVLITG